MDDSFTNEMINYRSLLMSTQTQESILGVVMVVFAQALTLYPELEQIDIVN